MAVKQRRVVLRLFFFFFNTFVSAASAERRHGADLCNYFPLAVEALHEHCRPVAW